MQNGNLKTVTLEEIRAMQARGELRHNPDAPEGPELPDEFWQDAEIVTPESRELISMRVPPEVKAFFQAESGKGYTRRMAEVLTAYVQAHQAKP